MDDWVAQVPPSPDKLGDDAPTAAIQAEVPTAYVLEGAYVQGKATEPQTTHD